MSDRQPLSERAIEIRRIALGLIHGAESGHPGSCLSAADLLAVLYFHELRLPRAEATAKAEGRAKTAAAANTVSRLAIDDGYAAADDRERTIKAVPDDITNALNVVPVDI